MNQNDTRKTNRDFHLSAFAVFVCLCVSSTFSQSTCALSAKIQPTLCAKLDSVQADQKLPIHMILNEPVFIVPGCQDTGLTPFDSEQCVSAALDSAANYWFTHRSVVAKLFSKYFLYDNGDSTRRIDSTAYFKATKHFYLYATKSTILAVTAESLVASIDLIPLSLSHCPATPAIGSILCAKLDSVTQDQKLPIYIILREPVFHVPGCEDRSAPPPDPKVCVTAQIDSETAYWTLHKSGVLRLFSTYSLYDTTNTDLRLDSLAFHFSREYVVSATKPTILAIAAESLVVAIGLIVPPHVLSIRQNNNIASHSQFSLRNGKLLAALKSGNLSNTAISVYSINGKNITASAAKGNHAKRSSIVIVKVNENGRSYYLKNVLVR
jgi:hypothetical protein